MPDDRNRGAEYLARLFGHVEGSQLPRGVFVVNVSHEQDCGIWSGYGCTCNPSVSNPLPGKN